MKITGSPAFYVKLKTVDAMKKLILFFVLCFSGTAVISAQNIEENAAVREALDKMLEHLTRRRSRPVCSLTMLLILLISTGMTALPSRTAIMCRGLRSSAFCGASCHLP